MQLFGGRRGDLERILASDWSNAEERDALLARVRSAGLRPSESVSLLLHGDAQVRHLGAELFLQRADADAVADLSERIQSLPPHIRGHLTRVLVRLSPDVARKAVDALLGDRNPARRRVGWDLLLQTAGEWRRPYLERALVEAPAALRLPFLQRLLQEVGAAALLDPLSRLATDEDVRVAGAAMEALVALPDPRLLPLMVDRLTVGDATSRELARSWLHARAKVDPRGIRRRMIELLAAGQDAARRVSVEVALATGPVDEVLVEILNFSRDLVGWLRERILETLRTFGDTVFRAAVGLLAHPEVEVRTAALVLAENFEDRRLVGPITGLLKDPDWWIRINACDVLGRLKDPSAVPALVAALQDDDARWAAIDALAAIGTTDALRAVAGLLRDPRPEVRMEVIRALSRLDDPRLVNLLAQVKEHDASSEVRTRAAEVLRDAQRRMNVAVSDPERGTAAGVAQRLARPIDRLLAMVRERGASDLHLTFDEPPWVRQLGSLERLTGIQPLTAERTREAIFSLLTERQAAILEQTGELDFCHAIPEVGRYRVNAFRQRRGWCAAFRVIPNVPPTFADLRIPGRLTELLDYHQGVILVSGPAGSGKSTTLAAIVNLINETKADHVITLEDPIEFVHPVKSALINQREVGTHTTSFARALRAALREDPDVIVVGEMRDVETVRLALTAAETGHLVIGTLHTTSAVATVDRLIKSFPPEEQAQVRMALSESLKYVVCQSLLPRKDGKGRVALFEVLKGTLPVGNLIRENKTYQLPSMMQIGRGVGMQTVDQALLDLVEADLIAPEAAWRRAEKPELFEALCSPEFLRARGVDA